MKNLNSVPGFSERLLPIITDRTVIEIAAPDDLEDTGLFCSWISPDVDEQSRDIFLDHLTSMQEHLDSEKVYLFCSAYNMEDKLNDDLTAEEVNFLCKYATYAEWIEDGCLDDIYFAFEVGTENGEPILATANEA